MVQKTGQFGGQLEIVTDITKAVKHSLHSPIQQLNNIRKNSSELIHHSGELAQTSQPLVSGMIMAPCDVAGFTHRKICGIGLSIPCSIANLYAKTVCVPTSFVEGKLRKVLNYTASGGGRHLHPSFQLIYEPKSGKWVSTTSRRGTAVLLRYIKQIVEQ